MAYAPPFVPPAPMGGGYPVQLSITDERQINRLWGIPFVGVFVRAILAIPHLIVLWILGLGMIVWVILGWIPILMLGRQPAISVKLLTELIHRGARVSGYVGLLLPGGYPGLEPGNPNPVDTKIDVEGRHLNRLWGIPLLGFYVRLIALIPHLIVLGILAIVVWLSFLILWIPILLMGRYPNAFASFYTGYLRYYVRVGAYALLLPVPYPPFSLS
jgi:hypothetical protein